MPVCSVTAASPHNGAKQTWHMCHRIKLLIQLILLSRCKTEDLSRRGLIQGVTLGAFSLALAGEADAIDYPPQGYRSYKDKREGYTFYFPQNWTEVSNSESSSHSNRVSHSLSQMGYHLQFHFIPDRNLVGRNLQSCRFNTQYLKTQHCHHKGWKGHRSSYEMTRPLSIVHFSFW